ncbi:MAG: hypothetical protein J5640_00820 [Bacteroidales bacterium]|nr:hypothetical protein [Bacteroidales bacterium]
MKTNIKLLSALLAMAFIAMPASAQQSARRNGSDAANRQENKVERQQTKVDKAQRPTNISNQNSTDRKVRDAGAGSDRGGFSNGRNGGSANNDGGRRPSGGTVNNGGNHGNGGSIGNNGSSGKVGNNSGSHNNGGAINNGGGKPSGGANIGGNHGGTVNNGGSIGNGGGNHGYSGNHGNGGKVDHNGGHKPHQGGHVEHARRPAMPTTIVYTRPQIYERTNANSIVVNTRFRTKEEAYDYIAALLDTRYYTIASWGNNYNWLKTDISYIPTPFDWTNPMTHNQFKMEFNITRGLFGTVKVTITAYWRESVLSTGFTRLRFQPSDSYSTYYAWRVLEDIAYNIPNTSVYYN